MHPPASHDPDAILDATLDATLVRDGQDLTTDRGPSRPPGRPPGPSDVRLEAEVLNVSVEHSGRYTWRDPADRRPNQVDEVPRHAAELGRGGIGRVLLAHDRHLDRDVAF